MINKNIQKEDLVLLGNWLTSNTLLDNLDHLVLVAFHSNTSVCACGLLALGALLCSSCISDRLLVVVAVVLCPGDLTWVALAFPHAESLAGLEGHKVLIFTDVNTAVASVEDVSGETADLCLCTHSKRSSQTAFIVLALIHYSKCCVNIPFT